MKKKDLPKTIPVFPISNFIIFPKTTVPLNIFEPRYIEMINDSMKSNKMIGMIQPKNSNNKQIIPELHGVGCLGKITSFKETEDGRYLIELRGLIRFKVLKEIKSTKEYREYEIDFEDFNHDLDEKNEEIKFTASNNTCFSSKLNGEAIASALIVSSKLCFSSSFQLIIKPLFSNKDFRFLKINSKSENFIFSICSSRS